MNTCIMVVYIIGVKQTIRVFDISNYVVVYDIVVIKTDEWPVVQGCGGDTTKSIRFPSTTRSSATGVIIVMQNVLRLRTRHRN